MVFVVAAPFVIVATELGLTEYEKSPKLFELGSINENDESEKLYTPLFVPNLRADTRG